MAEHIVARRWSGRVCRWAGLPHAGHSCAGLIPSAGGSNRANRQPGNRATTSSNGGNPCAILNSDSLVDRALESNLDLEIALTRLQEARTQEIVVIGEALPAGERAEGVASAQGQI